MQRISQLLIAGIAAIFMLDAYAVCPYPEEVPVPDGTMATTAQMTDGQARVKQYLAEMENYLACLEEEEAVLGSAPTGDQELLQSQRQNAAIDAMESMAAAYNEQVRMYKKQIR